MRQIDASQLYLRAVIRAQDSRHILTWSPDDLLHAYIIASIPGCTLDEFCKQLDITIDTEQEKEQEEPAERTPEQIELINENAINFFKQMSKGTDEVQVIEAVAKETPVQPKSPEPTNTVNAEAAKPVQEV